ncbi:THAP domain-containing protein 4-like isoform X2 [Sitophilus oryzae]|uniref:THAP domain-containing protein 4-like isoform X2 n=1 Tax=Sitophilus oryzae TaxID=7048 RepID=A0A6J2XQU5_SITOR|nr:THAP domain-containing protein 4-like isoform X2 [Sitophilus oryzae]
MAIKVHEVLKNVTWLIGTWKSIKAEVYYPTMKAPVQFTELLEFHSMGQPLLNYSSETRHPQNKSVMHLERGFLRVDDDRSTVALLTSQNFGLSTLEEGYVKDKEMVLATACIGIMKFAKQTVLALHRSYRLTEDGKLQYCAMMETPQTPLTKHVEVEYEKIKGPESTREYDHKTFVN